MRILMTSSWFPSRKHSTLGNFVQRHIEAIATMHEVVVLVWFRMDQGEGLEVVKSVENGVTIYRVYSAHRQWQWWKANAALGAGWAAINQDGIGSFDVVHHHVTFPIGIQAAVLADEIKAPLVVTEHWTIYNKQVRRDQPIGLKRLSMRVLAQAKVICPVSEDLAATMQAYGLAGNYQVIPNVVDTEAFQIGTPANGFHFLHISSLDDRHKNISGILLAWTEVCSKIPGAVLHIGGDGPHLHWSDVVMRMGIPAESIEFFGECSVAEVAQRMRQAHCLVMFSRFENLPVVIVEAMAAGLPVITSDVGGISEHVHKERGMLVQSEREDELQAALLSMPALWSTYDRQRIRAYAQKHFSRESVARQYDAVYRAAIGNGKD